MASAAQIAANRANAIRSTGPKTAEGKARVSQNAVTHGLTANQPVVSDEETREFADFCAGLYAAVKPEGAIETMLFEQLVHSGWNLRRCRGMEKNCWLELGGRPDKAGFAMIDRLGVYESRTLRNYCRILGELRTIQTQRALLNAAQLQQNAQPAPPLADQRQLKKQSQSGAPKAHAKPPVSSISSGILSHDARFCMANAS